VSGLDLASLGSPQNTEVGVYATTLVKGKPIQVKLGEFPVKNGLAKLSFRTRGSASRSCRGRRADRHDGRRLPRHVQPPDQGQARLATSKSPKPAIVGKTRTSVSIEVKVPGMQPKGWAAVKIGNKQYKGKLVDGKVVVKLPKFKTTGKKQLKVKYLGARTSSAPTSSSTSGWSADLSLIDAARRRPRCRRRVDVDRRRQRRVEVQRTVPVDARSLNAAWTRSGG
jgi:hypothetical protein